MTPSAAVVCVFFEVVSFWLMAVLIFIVAILWHFFNVHSCNNKDHDNQWLFTG